MQSNKKLLATLFVGILVLSIAVPLLSLPIASAQTGVSKNTFALVGAMPNPVGVGQETLITTGITHATAWPQPGWYGVTVIVTGLEVAGLPVAQFALEVITQVMTSLFAGVSA